MGVVYHSGVDDCKRTFKSMLYKPMCTRATSSACELRPALNVPIAFELVTACRNRECTQATELSGVTVHA